MNLICDICRIRFSTKFALTRHRKNKHGQLNDQSDQIKFNSKCNSCNLDFSKKTLLIHHLNKHHGMSINKEVIEFSNVPEFQTWLRNFESENQCEYIQHTGKRKSINGLRSYYECCRSGVHKEVENPKRSIKSQGSKKINQTCTSHIKLFEPLHEDKCIMTFYKDHYGHKENQLQHIRLPIKKKQEIATNLSQGVTFERVLDNFRENTGVCLKRENLLKRADLHNIKHKYNLILKDNQFHKNDTTSVHIGVERMKQEEENNTDMYYKKQALKMDNNLNVSSSTTINSLLGANNDDDTLNTIEMEQSTSSMYLPWKGYDDYFILISVQGVNFNVQCITCNKQYSVHKRASSNLKRHMQTKHPIKFEEFLNATSLTGSIKCTKRRNIQINHYNTVNNKTCLQSPLERFGSGNGKEVSQKTLDSMILKYIIEETQPLRVVDQPAFVNLVRLGLPKHLSIMCSNTLRSKIITMFDEMKGNLITTLGSTLWVSTTADCWTQGKLSFIGVTCHWIDIKTLEKKSAMLACSQIKGKHTYDVIARKIFSIHQDYGIVNKVLTCTTDNSSNVIKAFSEFNKDQQSEDQENDITFIDLDTILNEKINVKNDSDCVNLPSNRRCISHSLNLIVICDIDDALNTLNKKSANKYTEKEKHLQQYKQMYRKVIAKIKKLWNKQNQSNIFAEKIHEQFGIYLKLPNKTLWNGIYAGIKQINDLLKIHEGINKFQHILDFCSIPQFLPEEVDFIQEYVDVMKPLADSLDFFQGEESCYMGFLLPTLYALEKKYIKLKMNNYTFCYCLIETIISAIIKRFEPIWVDKNLIIAACLIPRFKLHWLAGTEMYYIAEEWLKAEFQKLCVEPFYSSDSNDDSVDDFFCIPKSNAEPKKTKPAQTQLSEYLSSTSRQLKSLLEHPKMLKIFIYYNVGLPSSAPVNKLFSFAEKVSNHQCLGLNDNLFENLLLLKCNKHNIV